MRGGALSLPPMLVDLLHPEPVPRIDADVVRAAATAAFASGGADGALDFVLDTAGFAPSDFEPSCFEHDLFLSDFVRRSLRVTVDKKPLTASHRHLVGLLAHPPSDPAVVPFRQAMLSELVASDALRDAVTGVYVAAHRLRTMLSSAPAIAPWIDIARRRVEILGALRDAVRALGAEPLAGSNSGLARLATLGARLSTGEPFSRLERLLELDESTTSLDVRLQVGFDGGLRGFDIVRLSDNAANPFFVSPTRRFWRRVVAFFRGFAFSDAEVLDRLVDGVFDAVSDAIPELMQVLGDLELLLAALAFRDLCARHGHDVCLPELAEPGGGVVHRRLEELFNPLLLGPKQRAVPCTVELPGGEGTAIVTGPNSGGKTRFLQAIAFAQLLAQVGCFVPARRAALVRAEGLFVSLVAEATPDQKEGRLGMELSRVRDVFERLGCGSMVLLDELCSGTNPSEGEEMFELVVDLLGELEPQAFVSTHFLDLAQRLETDRTRGLSFLQVELDDAERPTHRFVPGVARTSLARRTAERLGVTRAELGELVEEKRRLRASRASVPERVQRVSGPPEGAPDDHDHVASG